MREPEVVDLADARATEALEDGWRELAARIPASSYFQTPDWVISWWSTVAGRPRTRVAVWRGTDGRIEALVALSRDRQRLHRRLPLSVPVWANAGSGAGDADHCDWLVPAVHRERVAAWLGRAGGRGTLLLRGAGAFDRPPLPSGARAVESTTCPRVALEPGDPWPAGASRNLRRQLPRFTRRLEAEGVRFAWAGPGAVGEGVIDALFALHPRSRGREGAATSFGPEQADLHRRLARCGAPGRGPAAVVATRDGAVVGVLYGLWWGETFAAYQSGWEPDLARHSMGSVLVAHAMRHAAEAGARTFDFLRGTEAYKYRFGAHDEQDETWIVPRGVSGAVLRARYRARDSVKRSPSRAASVARLKDSATS